jgi:hypothetical protein
MTPLQITDVAATGSPMPAAPSVDRNGGPWQESLFHSEPWRFAVEEAFGVTIQRFTPRSEPDGYAYYSLIDDIRGRRLIATPFSDYCDPFLGPSGWDEFTAHLRSFDAPITIRPFQNESATSDTTFHRPFEFLWHGIDLEPGFDHLWDSLKSKLRTSIRRAPKAGITFRVSSSRADLEAFHNMHVELRRAKYGLLAQPFSFFAALHDNFGDDLAIVVAEEHDTPVAAMIYIAWNDVWYYKFSASVARNYRPNAALLIEACREGTERGLSQVDMGRSDIDQPGLISFKQQFATTEHPLTSLSWRPPEYTDRTGAEATQTLTELTELLTATETPHHVAAQAGDILYRYFA